MKIYKYELDSEIINSAQYIEIPAKRFRLLDVQFVGEKLNMWAEIEEEKVDDLTLYAKLFYKPISIGFHIAFTGDDAPDCRYWTYFKQLQKDGFVFHIYTDTVF